MNKDKRELLLFLAITFGLSFLTIPLAFLLRGDRGASGAGITPLLYPAAGLILAMLVCRRGDPLLPKRFFLGYLVLQGGILLCWLASFFLAEGLIAAAASLLCALGTIVLAVLYLSESKERRAAYAMTGKNWPQSLRVLALFLVLLAGWNLIPVLILEGPGAVNLSLGTAVAFLPGFLLVNLTSLFGEEYGWRTYFQPLLQKKFGPIVGVFLFGALWGLWHLPISLISVGPEMEITVGFLLSSVGVLAVNSIPFAVFLAYAYGKTGNLWLAVLIHGANNFLNASLFASTDLTGNWKAWGLTVLIRAALFLPFLFSPVFRKPKAVPPPSAPRGG